MESGAAVLLQFNISIEPQVTFTAVRVRARRTTYCETRCLSFSGSFLPSTRFATSVQSICMPGSPSVVGNGRGKSCARPCSESGVTENASEAAAFSDLSGIQSEIVGALCNSGGAVVLSTGRHNDSYSEDVRMETKELTGENGLDVFSAAAMLDKIEGTLHLLDQYQEKDRGTLLNNSQNQSVASLLGSGEESKSVLDQMREIIVFAGPALGIWLSGPLMSIIDTAVIGNSSSLELAALGPGTVLCDQTSYVFMFLSIATSNLIAMSLARKDEREAEQHLSRLLFVSLFCGVSMLLIAECFSTPLLRAFVGVKNYALIPAAELYVQIRALAWPAVLTGMVAQSASLGMQDSWAPLKVLTIASSVNLLGDILLCTILGHGIGGAAWATMASQYVGAFLMLKSVGEKGYDPLAISVPSLIDLINMFNLAGPILLTMLSKVAFYTIITFLATSLGPTILAAHQVMIGIFSLCTACGEPLAQTAQSFMPALIYGSQRNLKQACALLHTLMLIGACIGVILGCFAISVPWLFPQIFTNDSVIINQMRSLSAPFFLSLMMTPSTLSCEGTLLAGRDLKFLGFSMASCFCGCTLLLMMLNALGAGLNGSWWTLVAFQSSRLIQSYARLSGSKSIFANQPSSFGWEAREASGQLKERGSP